MVRRLLVIRCGEDGLLQEKAVCLGCTIFGALMNVGVGARICDASSDLIPRLADSATQPA